MIYCRRTHMIEVVVEIEKLTTLCTDTEKEATLIYAGSKMKVIQLGHIPPFMPLLSLYSFCKIK